MKHNPQIWRVITSGISIVVLSLAGITFALYNKEIALWILFVSGGMAISHGITITNWKGDSR